MTPTFCRIKHNPPSAYGDCFRACIASMLDIPKPETVPHFMQTGEMDYELLCEWLGELNLAPVLVAYDGDLSLEEVLTIFAQNNKGHYMLFGRKSDGSDHVWIMKGEQMVHDPAWWRSPPVSPNDSNMWVIMVLAIR